MMAAAALFWDAFLSEACCVEDNAWQTAIQLRVSDQIFGRPAIFCEGIPNARLIIILRAVLQPNFAMADDGMLMNFSLGDEPFKVQQSFKGGRWRDRVNAKKAAKDRQQKSSFAVKPVGETILPGRSGDGYNGVDHDFSTDRPAKRHRSNGYAPEGSFKPSSNSDFSHPGHGSHHPRQQQYKGNREVISSLFSYNPTSKAPVEEKPTEELEPSKPSNAPLIDGLSNFTGLGISPTLAAHLLTKMNLKAPTAIQKSTITQLLKEDSDAFIQAETGSGKTLAYLLPLLQRIMTLSKEVKDRKSGDGAIHRDSGLFAIVLAPTRELCKQISVVLENLLRCASWIVAGTVIGGEKKKSEKARLRKGLNILVATPGRLADHLDNTEVLDVSNLRWLVLDEGDRLMELGFEEELRKIVEKLDARRRSSAIPGLPDKRTTVLCSATLKMNVQKLGEISLKNAVHIKAEDDESESKGEKEESRFSAPAQLKQTYAVVAAKLRLVTLAATLKRAFARKGSVMKAIVFVSCADSVDFHFELFARKDGAAISAPDSENVPLQDVDTSEKTPEKTLEKERNKSQKPNASADPTTISPTPLLSSPNNPVTLHRLHGSLPQSVRTSTLQSFSRSTQPSILLCTDVASRGLDLPNIDLVIEYDPPFSSDDHLHRIGRTARAGRDGRAMIFLMPGHEEGYVEILKSGYRDGGRGLSRTDADEILRRGFGGSGKEWEEKASIWQLDVERWILDEPKYLEMARRAFQSHVRAYATHVAAERGMFNIKELHLGHLAKAFALRERPAQMKVPGLRQGKEEVRKAAKAQRIHTGSKRRASDGAHTGPSKATGDRFDVPAQTDSAEAAKRMRIKMKEHMAGASEFNIG